MPSVRDLATRALVTLLKSLATAYGLVLTITRDSADKDIRMAYRKVSVKTHPDKGGNEEDQKKFKKGGTLCFRLYVKPLIGHTKVP